jgi:peroxiredoxin
MIPPLDPAKQKDSIKASIRQESPLVYGFMLIAHPKADDTTTCTKQSSRFRQYLADTTTYELPTYTFNLCQQTSTLN